MPKNFFNVSGLPFNDYNSDINILNRLGYTDSQAYGRKCVALLEYDGKKYYAISGTEDITGNINQYQYVNGTANNFEVFTNKKDRIYVYIKVNGRWEKVSYEDYSNKNPDIEKQFHRLYSCCERKLFSLLDRTKNPNFKLYVLFSMCDLCKSGYIYLKDQEKYNGELIETQYLSVLGAVELKNYGLI